MHIGAIHSSVVSSKFSKFEPENPAFNLVDLTADPERFEVVNKNWPPS